MNEERIETDSMGEVRVPANGLWGAQTQRALEHFNIGDERFPEELIHAYVIVKKASALVNHEKGRLTVEQRDLIVRVCDEILSSRHHDQFPLHVWISGSGTQLNMNINEVISNRCCQLAGTPLGSKRPIHPNEHANMSQSSNDSFPTAMCIAVALGTQQRLIPAVRELRDALTKRASEWGDIIKIGRTHLRDAVPMTLEQEFSGYAGMMDDNIGRLEHGLQGVYRLALGGTAIGTGLNAPPGFDVAVAQKIAALTGLPFVTAHNKFSIQGSHDDLVHFSGALRTLAVSLHKIATDVRLLGSGPRCGLAELILPNNEPGSSIMPGKVNPTQCEALAMLSMQVIANDVAVTLGGSGGELEMNASKPLIIVNLLRSIKLLDDGCRSFRVFLIERIEPDRTQIDQYVQRSLMLVTALSPVIGHDRASQIARYASDHGLTLREAALTLRVISAEEFDRLIDPRKMTSVKFLKDDETS
jgi:fumarate hydratase, class II